MALSDSIVDPLAASTVSDFEDEEVLPGMTLKQVNDKHVRIRGSIDLKYPPRDQCCLKPCGHNDLRETGMPARHHVCVLNRHDTGKACEFSWECLAHAH